MDYYENRSYLEIDLKKIRDNVRKIQSHIGSAQIIGVIKGNAYGLGDIETGRALEAAGISFFAVDNVEEGIELRKQGIKNEILIIDGGVVENAAFAIDNRLIPGLPHQALLQAFQEEARKRKEIYPVWIMANIGFNRSGYTDEKLYQQFIQELATCSNLEPIGIYSHLTNSDKEDEITLKQINLFFDRAKVTEKLLNKSLKKSLFASHAIPKYADNYPTDFVRPGILLYGESSFVKPFVDRQTAGFMDALKPSITLKAKVTSILSFSDRTAIGYGQKTFVKKGQRLATISFGFGKGYPPGEYDAPVIIKGQLTHSVGRTGMDAMQIDISTIKEVEIGDWATLLGQDGPHHISCNCLATACNISVYELLSSLKTYRKYVRN